MSKRSLPYIAKRLGHRTAQLLPKGPLLALLPATRVLIDEIKKLGDLEATYLDDGSPVIRLPNGIAFSAPAFRDWWITAYMDERLLRKIPKTHARLATDIVYRYSFPHFDVVHGVPASAPHRKWFHAQHKDTINDLPLNDAGKLALKHRFALASGDVLFDIGSYLGFGALRASEMVGPQGKVICLDADPRQQDLIERNLSLNKTTNVELVRAACWKECGTLDLHFSQSRMNNSLLEEVMEQDETVPVRSITIDSLVEEFGVKPKLVSLTINGAELEGLQGMTKTLSEVRPALSIAGWFSRDEGELHCLVSNYLKDNFEYEVLVGPANRVYAWHSAT